MIAHWCEWVREIDPSIILGHNIITYDLPFLTHVAKLYKYEGLQLGRDESYMTSWTYPSKFRIDGSREQEYHKLKVYGREIIDTMFLSIKYDIGRKYESYGLKAIIKHENLEVKDRQFYDASTIKDNYLIPEELEIMLFLTTELFKLFMIN
jgi:DNA polymerase elongation subunit (family B)